MEQDTASKIAQAWLTKADQPREWLDRVANTLQRVVGQPQTYACTTDSRLVLLVKEELWIVTGNFSTEEVIELTIQTVHLPDEPDQCSLIEAYDLNSHRITYIWRFEIEGIADAFEFETKGEYVSGRESDDPSYEFGWQLATAIGWTQP